MFSTLLLTYVGSLSPSAQVWCGDQYLKAVQSALAENEQAFFRCFPSYYTYTNANGDVRELPFKLENDIITNIQKSDWAQDRTRVKDGALEAPTSLGIS